MKKIIYVLLAALIVLGACSTGDATAAATATTALFGDSLQALVFLNCKAVSEDEIEFEFSQPVTVKSVSFEPSLEIAQVEDGEKVKVKLEKSPGAGLLFTADMVAEDSARNSINVIVPFRSRNNRMPSLVINELCTETATVTAGKKEEFIEFKMKSNGNLGAMRVFILGNTAATKQTVYEFMPVEVKENEYVTLHLRTWDESCKDEYGGNMDESRSINSLPDAWDFWMPENDKLIHKAATAVYVLNQDDEVLDAVMISATADSSWKQNYFAEAAEFLFGQGVWKSPEGEICSPAYAVNSSATTNTRTICRDETVDDTNTAADWYIVYTSCATPGKKNNPRRWN